jgi:hypothetical protein
VLAVLAVPFTEFDDTYFGTEFGGEFRIVDVTDPSNPVELADWGVIRDSQIPLPSQQDIADKDDTFTSSFQGLGYFATAYGHSVRLAHAAQTGYVSYWDAGVLKFDLSDPADPQRLVVGGEALEHAGEVAGGRLTLDVRVGGDHDLRDALLGDARDELADAQLVRADAVDRADRPAEHVVAAAELVRLLDRDEGPRLLDDAEHGGVAPCVAADAALLGLGHVEAAPAEADLVLDRQDGVRETVGVCRFDGQQVEGDPLSALRPDAR